jgi:general nucleoside transport system permease protein
MNIELVLAAGIASGTILVFAAIGELFAERAGIINLGVQGMMFVGALVGFKVGLETDPWLGLLLAMAAGAALAFLHGVVCIHLQADQIVSGLALTFVGTGVALVLGEGLASAGSGALLPVITLPLLSQIPFVGPVFFSEQSILVYIGYCVAPIASFWIFHTRQGLHLRAVGEEPSAADALGVNVYRQRYAYTMLGGALAGLAGATLTMAIIPGWHADKTIIVQGWIAVALVIFGQWKPGRTVIGAYMMATIFRLTIDLQGPADFFGIPNIFYQYQPATFLLGMVPFVLVILVLILVAREANRKRIGAPAALGLPYVRGERGR